jgi:hypothetical protein
MCLQNLFNILQVDGVEKNLFAFLIVNKTEMRTSVAPAKTIRTIAALKTKSLTEDNHASESVDFIQIPTNTHARRVQDKTAIDPNNMFWDILVFGTMSRVRLRLTIRLKLASI